jgi:putative aldouronate transport system substrate-binding protein
MADVLKISKAFTHNDPDKNGKNDTFGIALEKALVGPYADLNGFMEGYHAYVDNAFLKNAQGKLVDGLVQPEVKTALADLAAMYKDGQIDKEFMVKDATKVAEDIVAGKVGMMFAQHWVPFYPLQDCKNKNPKADWKAYPIVSNDTKPARPMVNGSASKFYVINKNMKNPEAAMKLYNYYYAKDPALSKDFDPNFHGKQGEEETNPGNYFELAVIQTFYPKQNAYINTGVTKYFKENDQTMLQNYWVKDNIAQIKKYQAGDNTQWSAYAWSGVEGSESINNYYDSKKLWIQNAYIKADTESMTQKGATLRELRDTTFTKIIMGALPLSEFDKFVNKWKVLGGDDIVREVNAAK